MSRSCDSVRTVDYITKTIRGWKPVAFTIAHKRYWVIVDGAAVIVAGMIQTNMSQNEQKKNRKKPGESEK